MAAPDEVVTEPVIASSNRALDVEPYAKQLFAEDPTRWSQILPWEFPQNASKDDEQKFLHQFFTDREIRMQGGAKGQGNGFRFLKSVWYWAALWNLHRRLPAIVDWWFVQADNQELLQKSKFEFSHFLAPEAEPKTFFAQAELDLYGEKMLSWAVKLVQQRLKNQCTATSTADATSVQKCNVDIQVQEPPKPIESGATKAHSRPPAAATAAVTSTPVQPTSILTPSVAAFKGFDTLSMPQPRLFSGEANPCFGQTQTPSSERVGSAGKQLALTNDRIRRRVSGGKDSQPMLSHLDPYPMPGHSMSHSTYMSDRASSGGQYPAQMEPMSLIQPRQPDQRSDQMSIYGSRAASTYAQSYQPGRLPTGPQKVSYPGQMPPPGLPADPYHSIQQPFMDISNTQGDFKVFGADARFGSFGGNQSQRKQRHNSISTRGPNTRGSSSMRGRGSRIRGNFSHPTGGGNVMDPRFFDQSEHGEASVATVPCAPNHPFPGLNKSTWRSSSREENFEPTSMYRGGDARRYASAYKTAAVQVAPELHSGSLKARVAQTTVQGPQRHFTGTANQSKVGPFCLAGCSKDLVGANCTTARKVVIFGIPVGVTQEDLVRRLTEQYGDVAYISMHRPREGETKTPAWAAFESIESVRKILAEREGPALGMPNLTVQLAREHFGEGVRHDMAAEPRADPYSAFIQRSLPSGPNAPLAGPPQIAPMRLSQDQTSNRIESILPGFASLSSASDRAHESLHKGSHLDDGNQTVPLISGDSTPAVSSHDTPRKKKKAKNSKQKKQLRGDNVARGDDTTNGCAALSVDESNPFSRHDSLLTSFAGFTSHSDDGSNVVDAAAVSPANAETFRVEYQNPSPVKKFANQIVHSESAATSTEDTAAKADEDHVDETFYTANDSPGLDKAVRPEGNSSSETTVGIVEVTRAADSTGEHGAAASQSDASTLLDRTDTASASHVSLGSLGISAETASAGGGEDNSDMGPKRHVSSESEAVFETAPQTPMTPEPTSTSSSAKTRSKQKGPSQTESLSAYSGSKRQNKSKKNGGKPASLKRNPQKPTTSDKDGSDGKIQLTKQLFIAPVALQQSVKPNETHSEQVSIGEAADQDGMSKAAMVEQAADGSASSEMPQAGEARLEPHQIPNNNSATTSEAEQVGSEPASTASSRRPTIISKLSDFFTGKSAPTPSSPVPTVYSTLRSEVEAPYDLGAIADVPVNIDSNESGDGFQLVRVGPAEGKNKNKKTSKSRSRARKEGKVDTSRLIEADALDVAEPQATIATGITESGKVASVKGVRSDSVSRAFETKDQQKSNLPEAHLSRRKHKCVSSSKISANSPDSTDDGRLIRAVDIEKDNDMSNILRSIPVYLISSTDQIIEHKQMKVSQQTGKILEVAAEDQHPRTSPEVEAARARMEAMRMKEEQIKKDKAAGLMRAK